MSAISERELEYLDGQRLGRLATAGADGQPHVVPVGFQYDAEAEAIVIGGRNLAETKKFHDAEHNPHVAFVVDDLASVDPWRARGVEIRGRAQTLRDGGERLGPDFGPAWMQIEPTRVLGSRGRSGLIGGEARTDPG